MNPDIAAKIMRQGMEQGWFTAHSLQSVLIEPGKASYGKFVFARRIINGVDKAKTIADYAVIFQDALTQAGLR